MNENVDLRASAESPLPSSRGEGNGRILLAAHRSAARQRGGALVWHAEGRDIA